MVYRSDESDWESGSHASTFGGNPICCMAALKTIDVLEGGLLDHVRETGDHLLGRLHEMQARHPIMGDVRGRGLMVGVEIVRDLASKVRAPQMRQAIIAACYRRGLIIIGCGENTIRFAPPLIIARGELDEGLDVFEDALREVERT
jgi:4-aminobutyrate aminotransferase